MDILAAYCTALGLSTAAGLNAYLPMLAVGLFQRYTDLIMLPAPFDHLGDPLVIGIVALIGTLDFVGDKVPIVDHVLHAIGVVVAPVVGGILAFATARAVDLPPELIVTLGVVAALATHLARTAARPVSTATTGGTVNPIVSLGEDGVSGALSIAAVLAPALAAILAVGVLTVVIVVWRRWRAFGQRIQGHGPGGLNEGTGQHVSEVRRSALRQPPPRPPSSRDDDRPS
jgi:hypothetical protein